MKAAACALLGLCAACSTPSQPSSHEAAASSSVRDASLAAIAAEQSPQAESAARLVDASAQGTAPSPSPPSPAALLPATPRPRFQVRALTGRVSRGDTPLEQGAMLDDDAQLSLARGARLTLSLDDHVRVELTGPARVRALPRGQPALLVREGALTVDVAPRGRHGTHSAFWLATPLARVDVADSARLVVRVSPKGAGELVTVSGHAQLSLPEASQLLAAGAAHCVGPEGLGALSRPFSTLEQAAQVFASGPSCAGRAGTDGARRERELVSALDAVQQREQSEVSLLAEHTRLVALGDARAQAVRTVLAGSAAVLVRERAWAATQHAQLDAWLLGRAPTPAQKALLERAYRLAPY